MSEPAELGESWFIKEALVCYHNYRQIQEKVIAMEKEAMAAAGGHSRAAGVILLKRPDTQLGYDYLSLCADRDQYQRRAETAAAMATMLMARPS